MAGKPAFPGKTAPRLLQDLLTYDPRFEERAGRNLLTSPPPQHDPNAPPVPAVPRRNCRHTFFNKSEQSQLPKAGEEVNHLTVYKIAAFCTQCHWHIDVTVDLRDDGSKNQPCRRAYEYPLHHFLYEGSDEKNGAAALGSENHARTYTFRCSAPKCPALLTIAMKPPRFSENDITILTNRAHLRRRWEVAKELAGERADTAMARPVDAPDFLSTYLQDCLNPQKGKSRIPLLNRKFLKTFGRDCDSILKRLGFTHHTEIDDDENPVEVWHLPKPPEAKHPLESTERNVIEDARYELDAIIVAFPESERVNARHQPMHPMPSRGDIERALSCDDYEKAKGRIETRNSNHEEDHPYYAGLGAMADFSDILLLWAFSRQAALDETNNSYYFECLQDLAVGRRSAELETQVALLASQGMFNRREVAAAYRFFGIDPQHADAINDDHIIGVFRSRLSDIGPSQTEETRKQLRIIGNARGSQRIQQESSDAIETYEQALSWLDLDEGQPDDFVITMLTLKTNDSPGSIETARKAVSIIARHRNSHRLRDFLNTGTMEEAEMDVGEAYALLRIPDRASRVPLAVLQSQVAVDQAENPASAEKLQKAFEIVLRDQEENFNNVEHDALPLTTRKQEHPLESWPVGCQNIGNTCYLNSVLQFLFTIKPLREMVLNCEEHMQDISPQALENKKVGRSAVTPQRVEVSQKFVRELRTFFEQMITAPTHDVRPAVSLAALALTKTEVPEAALEEKTAAGDANLGTIEGAPIIGPMPNPNVVSESITTPADSVMGDDNEDADSMKAMDLGAETRDTTMEERDCPPPPTRPPPVPPRPQTSSGSKIQVIEESARQQDAAEIMQNIFDLLSCAIEGNGVLRDGEQQDLVKRLFFSDVTTVRSTKEGAKPMKNSALQDSVLVSTKGRDRHLYAGLDDEFGLSEEENGVTKFEYFAEAAPIQIITVRRQQFDRETKLTTKDKSYLALDPILYLDRYLYMTKSFSEAELQKLREVQWQKQQQLRALECRRKELQETEFQNTDLATVLEETANIADEYSKANGNDNARLLEALLEKASSVRQELEAIDAPMAQLENEIDSVFRDCHEHPYVLHAVFMHRGNSSGGHYWIYIFDFQNHMWRKYNDDYVDEINDKLIYDKEEGTNPATSTGIVYIRRDLADKLTEAVKRQPVAPEVATTNDVKMEDAADEPPSLLSEPVINDLQVINGIDPSKE